MLKRVVLQKQNFIDDLLPIFAVQWGHRLSDKSELHFTQGEQIIGASMSEPHTSELNGNFCVCVGIVRSGTCSN